MAPSTPGVANLGNTRRIPRFSSFWGCACTCTRARACAHALSPGWYHTEPRGKWGESVLIWLGCSRSLSVDPATQAQHQNAWSVHWAGEPGAQVTEPSSETKEPSTEATRPSARLAPHLPPAMRARPQTCNFEVARNKSTDLTTPGGIMHLALRHLRSRDAQACGRAGAGVRACTWVKGAPSIST